MLCFPVSAQTSLEPDVMTYNWHYALRPACHSPSNYDTVVSTKQRSTRLHVVDHVGALLPLDEMRHKVRVT